MSLLHIAGGAGGATEDKLDASDVFSTYLYTGNGSTQTIKNGIDLAGKGGLVWTKCRSVGYVHSLSDTDSNIQITRESNGTGAGDLYANMITSVLSNGYTLGNDANTSRVNENTRTYASWTFRKAPKFFDIVTYTGNGVAGRQIPHNLGCEVGMIIVKRIDSTGEWLTYHKDLSTAGYGGCLRLNSTNDQSIVFGAFRFGNDTKIVAPTSSVFTVGSNASVNSATGTYVAYLFAHDTSADGIIQCGSFTTDGSSNATVNIGWEPQYVLHKSSTSADDWRVADNIRGMGSFDYGSTLLRPNTSGAETAGYYPSVTSTGFRAVGSVSQTYIYMAIRRPNKVPTSGSEVFAIDNGNSPSIGFNSGFPVDMTIFKSATSSDDNKCSARLIQGRQLVTNSTDSENTSATWCKFDYMKDWSSASWTSDYYSWMFKRAKGFFDVVCYTGTGVARTVNHNLGVAPELMIVKSRGTGGSGYGWVVGSARLATWGRFLFLNLTGAVYGSDNAGAFNNTAPTSSVFTVNTWTETNGSANTYIAYLFASLPGISKVGSYTGNGSSQTINCGFSTGARFVLCKSVSATGNWNVGDSTRGITSGTDPLLCLNTTAAEVTTDDWLDPSAEGFIVNETSSAHANTNGVQYVFLAIA